MKVSSELQYRDAKYQVVGEHFIYQLEFDYGLTEDWYHPDGWYGIFRGEDGAWYVIAYIGCAWDGATKYPDFPWMMIPSLVHDILHWLIKRGVVHPKYNDVADLELYYAIITGKEPIPWQQGGNSKFVRKVRAKLILRAVNIVNEKTLTNSTDVEHRSVSR